MKLGNTDLSQLKAFKAMDKPQAAKFAGEAEKAEPTMMKAKARFGNDEKKEGEAGFKLSANA